MPCIPAFKFRNLPKFPKRILVRVRDSAQSEIEQRKDGNGNLMIVIAIKTKSWPRENYVLECLRSINIMSSYKQE